MLDREWVTLDFSFISGRHRCNPLSDCFYTDYYPWCNTPDIFLSTSEGLGVWKKRQELKPLHPRYMDFQQLIRDFKKGPTNN